VSTVTDTPSASASGRKPGQPGTVGDAAGGRQQGLSLQGFAGFSDRGKYWQWRLVR
jgi:hypothetical protein